MQKKITKNSLVAFEKVGEFVSIFMRGERWHANYQLNGKQCRPSLKTTSKKEARLRAARLEAKLLAGTMPQPAKSTLIGDAVNAYKAYMRTEERADKTRSKYFQVCAAVVKLAEKRKVSRVDAIDASFVDAYRQQRQAEYRRQHNREIGAKTLYTETVIVKQLVNFAVSRGLLRENPLQNYKIKKPKPTPQPCWSQPEVQRILKAAAQDPYYSLYCLLSVTGLRIGEAKHLTWADLNLEQGILHVRPKEVSPGKSWKPKNGEERVVPINQATRTLLAALPRDSRWLFPRSKSSASPNADRRINERLALTHLKAVLKKVGLKGKLHTFRHSFITHALTRGVPEAVVRRWVGHISADVLKLYTHIADSDAKAHMDRLQGSNQPVDSSINGEQSEASDSTSAQFQHNPQEAQNGRSAN